MGQGANQALQDGYSLALHIRDFNHRQSAGKLAPASTPCDHIGQSSLLYRLLDTAFELFWLLVNLSLFVLLRRPLRTPLQEMAYQYEKRRKLPVAAVTLLSRLLGYVMTMGGFVGYAVKLFVLRALHYTGLGEVAFCLPMKVVV